MIHELCPLSVRTKGSVVELLAVAQCTGSGLAEDEDVGAEDVGGEGDGLFALPLSVPIGLSHTAHHPFYSIILLK